MNKLKLLLYTLFAGTALAAQITRNEYYVPNVSLIPNHTGNIYNLYVREKVADSVVNNPNTNYAGRVVLMIHGFSVPGEPVFDLEYPGYSWMEYLAAQGFDVFLMDISGYGRSEKPAPMNDSCNLDFLSKLSLSPPVFCSTNYPFKMNSAHSETNDIKAVVDYIKTLRNINSLNLIGHSMGGGRVLLYTATYPADVDKLFIQGFGVLNQNYNQPNAPANMPTSGNPVSCFKRSKIQDWADDRACDDQLDATMTDTIWNTARATDPRGRNWDSNGAVRYPSTIIYGLTLDTVQQIQCPVMLVTGELDNLASINAVGDLYNDLTCSSKVLMEVSLASHSMYWEVKRNILFDASAQWMGGGSFDGRNNGDVEVMMDDSLYWGGVFNDNLPPGVWTTYPLNGSNFVPLNVQHLLLTLDERVFSPGGYLTIYRRNNLTVKQMVAFTDTSRVRLVCPNTFEIEVDSLEPNTDYLVYVDADAFRDDAFNDFPGLLCCNSWVFSTGILTGLENQVLETPEIKLYPNPANEMLHIKYNATTASRLQILSTDGRVVCETLLTSSTTQLPTAELAPGLYVCRVISDQQLYSQRILISH